MFIDSANQLHDGDPKRIVIVGGGTLGIYFGVLMARQGREVVIIEAGNESLGNFSPETFESVGFPHRGIKIGRSKSLGGTSNLWGGQLVEFQRADFAGREWLPDSKWPVSYEEIARYYSSTYRNLGVDTNQMSDAKVFEDLRTKKPKFGAGIELFLTRWLKIPSLAAAFHQELESSPKIRVLLNHTVVGFEGDGDTVRCLQVVDGNKKSHRVDGGSFVLASGTIEITRLLLHASSQSTWPVPWRTNENVGCYFQDHIGGRVGEVRPLENKRFLDVFSHIVLKGSKFQPKLRYENVVLENEKVMNMHSMLHFESSISENLVFLKQFLKAALYHRKLSGFAGSIKNLLACSRHLPPLIWRYIVQNRVFVPIGSKISFVLQSEQTPLKSSRITIDKQRLDGNGLPKVILDWKLGYSEFPAMRDFALRCREALKDSGLAELQILPGLLNQEEAFFGTMSDNYHHVGGARMGWTQDDGVVDANLKVFGTSNMYVLGAATFRTASNANTTFVALSFATRLAENLAKEAEV
jgi:choline dehydrogenase-like flavoprotein